MTEKELSLSNAALTKLIQDAITKEASFRFQAKGFSMLPFIRDGDVITIAPLSCSFMAFGDSVAFIHPKTGNLVIHRIISRHGNSYMIKGDNIFKPDGLITREDILGYVASVERNGKKALFGLGPERFLIALLSRVNVFCFLLSAHRVMRLATRNLLHE